MSASAERAIDDDLARARIKPLQHFSGQNGNVYWRGTHTTEDTTQSRRLKNAAIDPKAPPCALGWVDARAWELRGSSSSSTLAAGRSIATACTSQEDFWKVAASA